MKNILSISTLQNNFHLEKWYIDIVTENGNTMIFYAAKLKWKKWDVPYTSWLSYNKETGITCKSRFRKVKFPKKKNDIISWSDHKFHIYGIWKAQSSPIKAQLFKSNEGELIWNCFQPRSKVSVKLNGKEINGFGYSEKLTLNLFPWKLQMKELRWGRYTSKENYIVWIEIIKETEKQQWLWVNGIKYENSTINNNLIYIPKEDLSLILDQKVILEEEKKILKTVKVLLSYLPSFNNPISNSFLNADEFKWLSQATLSKNGNFVEQGWAIHEFVNFNQKTE